jgi:hypothetical protein
LASMPKANFTLAKSHIMQTSVVVHTFISLST